MQMIDYISIVDDDPITIFGIRKLLDLTVSVNKIDTFSNGKSALDSILCKMESKEPLPQIIFLDLNMPIMDGWEFLEAFIKLPIAEKVRINIVTSSIDSYDINQWHNYRARTHHLITFNNKPLKKIDLENIAKLAS
jgi:CheY-like chemotaxis protein